MIVFGPARINDAGDILRLQKLAYQSEARLYNDWSLPPLVQTIEELHAEFETTRFLKATDGERLVGSVRTKFNAGTVEIGRLIVDPSYQRRGIGAELLRRAEGCFAGARRFELFTGSRSEGNLKLYERNGYAVTGTRSFSPTVSITFMEKHVE